MAELRFRPLRPTDLPALSSIVADLAVVRQLGSWPWPPEPDFTAARCRPYEGGDGFVWGIFAEKRLIGTIGITGGVIGYMLRPSASGKGYATRAGRTALVHAFADPALSEIRAAVWHDNPASSRVLQKLGFEFIGVDETPSKARGTIERQNRYLLTRDRWQSLSPRPASATRPANPNGKPS